MPDHTVRECNLLPSGLGSSLLGGETLGLKVEGVSCVAARDEGSDATCKSTSKPLDPSKSAAEPGATSRRVPITDQETTLSYFRDVVQRMIGILSSKPPLVQPQLLRDGPSISTRSYRPQPSASPAPDSGLKGEGLPNMAAQFGGSNATSVFSQRTEDDVVVGPAPTSDNDAGSSGQAIAFHFQSRELPSRRLLGKGLSGIGYETIWKGEKFARKDFLGVPRDIFEKEAVALVGLKDHKNIVKTYGWTADKRSCSLVLEYMDDDLLSLLQKRTESKQDRAGSSNRASGTPTSTQPLILPEAMHIMFQIASGMEYLHEQGIAHGDLKTKNILVTYMNDRDQNLKSVKVADFGLVRTKRKSKSAVSRQVRKLDTVQWKAPEYLKILFRQLNLSEEKAGTSSESDSSSESESESNVNFESEMTSTSPGVNVGLPRAYAFAADVYSFAVTCVQILTGEIPYPNLNWKESVVKILSGLRPKLPVSFQSTLESGLLGVLLELCWGDPDQRPPFSAICSVLEVLIQLEKEDSEAVQLNISNPLDDGNHSTSKPATTSSLAVSPPRDNAAFFGMTNQMLGEMTLQRFLTASLQLGVSIDMAPSTALPVGNPVVHPTHSFDNRDFNNQDTTSLATLKWQSGPLDKILNANMMSMPGSDLSLFSQSHVKSLQQGRSPSPRPGRSLSPLRFGDVSPLTSPRTSTQYSPFSPDDDFCDDAVHIVPSYSWVDDADHIDPSRPNNMIYTARKMPDLSDESGEIQCPSPQKQTVKKDIRGLNKRVREPRYEIKTRTDVDIMDDGYKWRKYGQKPVKNSPHPRSYYSCTSKNCGIRKWVERAPDDPGLLITSYEGTHNHPSPHNHPISCILETKVIDSSEGRFPGGM